MAREDESGTEGRHEKMAGRGRPGRGFFCCAAVLILQIVLGVLFCVELYRLDILPALYMGILTGILLLMAGIELALALQRTRISYAAAGILAVCFTVCISVGCVYARKTAETLESISSTIVKTEFDQVSVAVLTSSGIENLEELSSCSLGIQTTLDRENTDMTVEALQTLLGDSLTIQEYEGIYDMVQALYNGSEDAIVFNEAYRDLIIDSFETFKEDIRVLNTYTYTTTVEVEDEWAHIRENFELEEEPFIVYFSGIDTYGDISTKSRSDVNILAIVNPVSKQVALVTTPRDYYVALPFGEDCMDKLTHAGIYGIDCSIQTLENLYDIHVDYYLRVNFTGFMGIVDALGGVTVYSEREFTSEVGKYDFTVGYNEVDGKMALGFVRERHSFAIGDVQRARNQMAMIRAIVEKATSPSILTTYSAVLDSIQDSINTNMSTDDIATLVKMQLTDNASWNIQTYSTSGADARRTTYSMGSSYSLYVTLQDEDSIQGARDLIQKVWDGEILETEETTVQAEEETTESESADEP